MTTEHGSFSLDETMAYHAAFDLATWEVVEDAAVIVSPAGVAATHGGISATLRDLARWGMLHTPSWSRVAAEPAQVLPDAYLAAIRDGGRPAIFDRAGQGRDMIRLLGGQRPRHNTYQWDLVMEDGRPLQVRLPGAGPVRLALARLW